MISRSIGKELTKEEARVQPWFDIDGDKKLRVDYPLNQKSLVYDVGGYLGEWAEPIHKRYGCQIEIFEPVESFARKIEKKFDGVNKIHVHRFGLGGKGRNLKISLEDASSSVFKSADKDASIKIVAAKEVMPAKTKIDLIKINIEGGEYELLEHLIETGLIKNIATIQVQFHIFVPDAQAKRKIVQQKLSKTHDLTYSYPWIWENWRLRNG